jgi:hypothetical protein
MRFPYPLDDCECGHYRIHHNAMVDLGETTCNVCRCSRFSLNQSDNERSEAKTQA